MEAPEKEGLLHGIRILDLANEKAGFCSKVLADLGALVIKVEKPGGDSARKVGPFLRDTPFPEASLFFFYNNTNKLGITLDIEKEEGRKLFVKMIKTADVVVETFPPGYLETLGCPFRVMSKANPGLILASVTGFGQTGPRHSYKSCDLVTSAFGGQMYVSGTPSTPPLRPYGEQSFYVTSLFAAVGILLALIKRRTTGKGEHIDISSQEAAAGTLDHVLVRYFYDGVIPKRQGNLFWNRSSFILPCKDGHIHINIGSQWETLVEWMVVEGMAEDLTDEKWRDEDYRHQNIDHIMNVLESWTSGHDVGELFEIAQAMRFPWAPVFRPKDVFHSPQLQAREFFSLMDHPESGGIPICPGMPYRFDGSPSGRMSRAPLLGEDNVRIYRDELGLSREEIERLASLGII
jgi:crotonobetainyl-CoA:carnitine CoA-transferase CaiB-like acyl-CoA transferase